MARTKGAVQRSYVRIVDRAGFARCVARIAHSHPELAGYAAVAHFVGVPKARVSEWLHRKRAGLSRAQWTRLAQLAHSEKALRALWDATSDPADGSSRWADPPPNDQPRKNRARAERIAERRAAAGPPLHLEDVPGFGHAVVEHMRRGRTGTRQAMDAWPYWRTVLVPPAVLDTIRARFGGAFEYDQPIETDRGERVPVVLWSSTFDDL
jgi:hypothetical protein